VTCCCEKLIAEAGNRSGTQRRGMSAVGNCYQAMASEDCNRLRTPSVSCSDLRSIVTSCIKVK
jgi:hypothetical protein